MNWLETVREWLDAHNSWIDPINTLFRSISATAMLYKFIVAKMKRKPDKAPLNNKDKSVIRAMWDGEVFCNFDEDVFVCTTDSSRVVIDGNDYNRLGILFATLPADELKTILSAS